MLNPTDTSSSLPVVNLIGYGAAGRALSLALHKAGYNISTICDLPDSPNLQFARQDGFSTATLSTARLEGDLLIFAVPDGEIESLANSLSERSDVSVDQNTKRIALHLSGALGLTPLQPFSEIGWQRAAFHPIQTFPPGCGAERFKNICAGITTDQGALPVMLELARSLGVKPMNVAEQDRARYHLASVLVSNFLPLLLDLGAGCLDGIAEDRRSAENALLPLMQGMLDSLAKHRPADALTGPVARNDQVTVKAHLTSEIDESTLVLYRQLTHALVDLAEREGRLSAEQAQIWRNTLEMR